MIEIEGTGIADQGAAGNLPEKVPGRHRWIVVASYVLTDAQADASYNATRNNEPLAEPILFDNANRLGVDGPGCIDCEQPYYTCHKRPCPARAFDYKKTRK